MTWRRLPPATPGGRREREPVTLVEWLGAVWSVDHKEGPDYACHVVRVLHPASGWTVGDHCLLKPQEVHPTNGDVK